MIKITFICDWCEKEQNVPFKNISFIGRTITPIVSYKGQYGRYCHTNCKQAEKLAFKIADRKAWSERLDFLETAKSMTLGALRAVDNDMCWDIKNKKA